MPTPPQPTVPSRRPVAIERPVAITRRRERPRQLLALLAICLAALVTGWVQAAPAPGSPQGAAKPPKSAEPKPAAKPGSAAPAASQAAHGSASSAPSGSAPGANVSAANGSPGAPQSGYVHGLAPLPGDAPVPLHLRPPGARADDGGPSPIIFPAQKLTIRFNHKKHSQELGLTCKACHDAAASSQKSSDRLLPSPERCDGCHATDHRDLSAVTADASELIGQCGFCHIGYKEGDKNRVARLTLPKPNLKFSHKAHIDRNIGCEQCHGAVEELELATRDQLPRMSGCLKCHQAPEPARGDAKGQCTTCHLTERPGGTLRTQFPQGQLTPPNWLHNAGHTPDWLERHKYVAGADSQLCSSCHTEKYCTDCHDGRVRPRKVHPNDFISSHPIAARQGGQRCTSCHQQQSFCVGCHQRAGVTLSGPYGQFAGRGRFHPPKAEWTDPPRSASHHAWEAQRNLNACVSCHQERDCLICHSTAAVGGRGMSGMGTSGQGVNPHPTGFRSRCGTALRKNARACLTCHDPADPQLRECR
ncbi:MAG: cytochrome c3 family protein [Polyangiaceae bacterium]|nr:cytochrome c3 family protein [Polyangiaceae bacterium]MCW5789301.1 cytochrome c3 family protein [Polyangiaceae bacterium]